MTRQVGRNAMLLVIFLSMAMWCINAYPRPSVVQGLTRTKRSEPNVAPSDGHKTPVDDPSSSATSSITGNKGSQTDGDQGGEPAPGSSNNDSNTDASISQSQSSSSSGSQEGSNEPVPGEGQGNTDEDVGGAVKEEEESKSHCQDFCPMFAFKCPNGSTCDTEQTDCQLVCRMPDGSSLPLSEFSNEDNGKEEEETKDTKANGGKTERKPKCKDQCPMAPGLCQNGEVCVTNENCDLVCRKPEDVQSPPAVSDDQKSIGPSVGFVDNTWKNRSASLHAEQQPRDGPKESPKCDDFCALFSSLCKVGQKCVTDSSCQMKCQNSDGSEDDLGHHISTASPTTLRPLEERACGRPGKECVHGKCTTDGLNCTCDRGYVGDLCSELECYVPCTNGVCVKEQPTVSKCECQPGWAGMFCHEPACTRQCEHGGSCMWDTKPEPSMFCSCEDPWIGELCEKLKPKASNTLALTVGIATPVVCVLVLIISWYILWRKRVIFVFKIINMFKAYEDDDDKLYDAYVSLTDADYIFVKHVLQPKLEGMGHRLYLHARDSAVGDVKSEKILEAVEKSRRCIILLSSDYISNEWCRFEYLIAQHETCIKLKQRIIPILIDDIDKDKKKMDKTLRFIVDSVKCLRYPILPPELSDGQYSPIDLGSGHPKSKELASFERRQARFFERLRLSMPKKREPSDVKSPTLSCNSQCPLSEHVHFNNRKGVRLFFDNLSGFFPFSSRYGKSAVNTLTTQASTCEKADRKPSVALVSAGALEDRSLDSFYTCILNSSSSSNKLESDCGGRNSNNVSKDFSYIKTLRLDLPSEVKIS